jgi:phosphohistidine phosphatase SixA
MRPVALLALALNAVYATGGGAQTRELRGAELMTALRSGGYSVIMRHARTDRSFQEEINTVPAERTMQRNLSDAGVKDARLMRIVFEKYRIPFGEIVVSPMYRTRETAEYAAGKPTSVSMALRVFPSTDETAAIVSTPAAKGTNRLIVTHHFVIERFVPGIKPGDIDESEAAVVRVGADHRVELVGRIKQTDWEALAGAAASAPSEPPHPAGHHPAPSAAEVSASLGSIPGTPPGALAKAYLDAFNSGKAERMRAFIESSLVPNPARTTADRLQTFEKSFQDFGPMMVTGVRASAAEEITIGVRGRSADYVLTVKTSPEQPLRAASITIGTIQGGHP